MEEDFGACRRGVFLIGVPRGSADNIDVVRQNSVQRRNDQHACSNSCEAIEGWNWGVWGSTGASTGTCWSPCRRCASACARRQTCRRCASASSSCAAFSTRLADLATSRLLNYSVLISANIPKYYVLAFLLQPLLSPSPWFPPW